MTSGTGKAAAGPSQDPRERARQAQRRSRLARRIETGNLEARVEKLASAIDEMTAIFIGFSDNVLASQSAARDQEGLKTTKEYLSRFLDVARASLDPSQAETEEDYRLSGVDDLLSTATAHVEALDKPVMKVALPSRVASASPFPQHPSTRPTSTTSTVRHAASRSVANTSQEDASSTQVTTPSVRFSPRLDYGLLHPNPFTSMDDDVAETASRLLPAQQSGFAPRLFWQSIASALAALRSYHLSTESASLGLYMFRHSLRHESITWMIHRLDEKLRHRSRLDHLSKPYVNSTDPEWDRIKRLRDAVAWELEREGHTAAYIDAWGVESRLASYWGLDISMPLRTYSEPSSTRPHSLVNSPRLLVEQQPLDDVVMHESSYGQTLPVQSISTPALIPPFQPQTQARLPSPPLPGDVYNRGLPVVAGNFAKRVSPVELDQMIGKLSLVGICNGAGPIYPITLVDRIAQSTLVAAAA